jgi:hypothetical protein
MYHMADLIEELDIEFMDEVDCEDFLDVQWFISWGWCDNCDFCFFFLVGMWRCLKFIAFYCIVVNHMTFIVHKWGWGWWNDFWIKDIVQKTFPCFKIVRPSSCFNLNMCLSSSIWGFDVYWVLLMVGLKVFLGLYVSWNFEWSWAIWD